MRAGRTHYKGEANTTYDVGEPYSKRDIPEAEDLGGSGAFMAGSDIESEAGGIKDFTKYPREFITYRWYRPLITAALTAVFFFVLCYIFMTAVARARGGDFSSIMENINGGYDSMDVYTGSGALVTLGGIALMIPALAIANKLAGRRTFKSYESSRGGWNFGIFFKMLLLGLVFAALPIFVYTYITGGKTGDMKFSMIGLAICIVLGPMQCIAEEYIFRGLLMQTFGSWFKIPVLAIVIQTIIFASQHPYDIYGVIEVTECGLFYGFTAWLTHGLETGSAHHICNNMTIYLMTGFGFGSISSETGISSMMFSVVMDAVFLIVILILKKRGVFEDMKYDDAAMYNAKIEAKRAAKEAKRAAKEAKRAAKAK